MFLDVVDRPTTDVLVKGRGKAEHLSSSSSRRRCPTRRCPGRRPRLEEHPIHRCRCPTPDVLLKDTNELEYEQKVAQNKYDMSVTPDVSHVEIWPYAASAAALSESQRATAVLMLSLSSALPATAGTKLATHRSAAGLIIVAQGQPYHAAAAPRARKAAQSTGWSWLGPAVRNILREEDDEKEPGVLDSPLCRAPSRNPSRRRAGRACGACSGTSRNASPGILGARRRGLKKVGPWTDLAWPVRFRLDALDGRDRKRAWRSRFFRRRLLLA